MFIHGNVYENISYQISRDTIMSDFAVSTILALSTAVRMKTNAMFSFRRLMGPTTKELNSEVYMDVVDRNN